VKKGIEAMSGNGAVGSRVQVWQYLVLEHEKGGPSELARRCNELGAEGWELVTAIPMARSLNGGATTCVRLFFKKPRLL
jgi:hypothetical protein